MKKQIADYEVRPGVVPSGEKARVQIIPRGRHARFDDQIHVHDARRDRWKKSPFPPEQEVFEWNKTAEYRIYFLPMQEMPGFVKNCDSVLASPCDDGSLAFEYTFRWEKE